MISTLASSAAVLALTLVWCIAGLSSNLRRTGGSPALLSFERTYIYIHVPSTAYHILETCQLRASQRVRLLGRLCHWASLRGRWNVRQLHASNKRLELHVHVPTTPLKRNISTLRQNGTEQHKQSHGRISHCWIVRCCSKSRRW
jgi:hypothetical protein